MEARISYEQGQLLIANEETRDLFVHLAGSGIEDASIVLSGTLDELDELREACSDLLLRIGFDENYKATPTGSMLESLIDQLFFG